MFPFFTHKSASFFYKSGLGSTYCTALILLLNFTAQPAMCGLAGNPGFENSTSGYSFTSAPAYSINTNATYIRSGAASLRINTTSTTDLKASHTAGAVTATANGYVIVTAYVKGENALLRSKLGIYNSSTSTESSAGSYTAAVTGSFTKLSASFSCIAGQTYYPMIFSNSSTGAAATGEYDDLVIYFSSSSTVDGTAPATPPTAVQASVSGTTINLNWTAGNDAESGVEGYLIVRLTGASSASITPLAQVNYATVAAQGPTAISTSTVIYNGNATTYSDNPGSTGSYTYLVYTRDRAYNYTAAGSAACFIAINGSALNALLPANMSVDGLYIAPSCSLTVSSTRNLTLRTGSNFTIDGTLVDEGGITNNGTVTFLNGSTYVYDHNAVTNPIIPATWNTGSMVQITGIKNVVTTGFNQTFANLTWNAGNQNRDVPLDAAFNVTGTFTMANSNSRTVTFNSASISGNIIQTGGDLAFTTGTAITLNGSAKQVLAVTGALASLSVNNTAGVALGVNTTINETLNLQSGSLTDSSFALTMATGSTIHRSGGTLAETPTFAGTVNLVYSENVTTGNEVRAAGAANVTINVPSALTLGSILRVNGVLTLTSGRIAASSTNYLFMAAGSSVSGASNATHVTGEVRKTGNTAFTFPIGDGTTYAPLAISAPSSATDQFSATYNRASTSGIGTALGTGVEHVSAGEYWTLNRTIGTSTVAATLSWNSASLVTWVPSLLVTTWNGSQWISQGNASTTGTTSSGTITSAPLSAFGNITLGSSNHAANWLPVELISFTSKCDAHSVLLSWTTASESNNDYFELSRSKDALQYETIAKIPSAGNVQGHTYGYEDFFSSHENQYYQLVQVDYDGTAEILSNTASFCNNRQVTLQVYNADAPKLKAVTLLQGNYTILITEITGRKLTGYDVYLNAGMNIVDLGTLPTNSVMMCILSDSKGQVFPVKFLLEN